MILTLKALIDRFPQYNIKITTMDCGGGLLELVPKKSGTIVNSTSSLWGPNYPQKTFVSAVIKVEELLCKTTN